jgi:hypothetical protein
MRWPAVFARSARTALPDPGGGAERWIASASPAPRYIRLAVDPDRDPLTVRRMFDCRMLG